MAIQVDHTLSRGILQGLIPIRQTLARIVAGRPDAITMTKGLQNPAGPEAAGKASLLLKCSNYAPVHPTYRRRLPHVEEAVRHGADASIRRRADAGRPPGGAGRENRAHFEGMHEHGDAADRPHLPQGRIPSRPRTSTKWQNIAYCCRSGAELGVDIITTTYNRRPRYHGQGGRGVPCAVRGIQGGDAYKTLTIPGHDARCDGTAGVGGVTMGRFVWEYRDVTALVVVPAQDDP